MYLQSLRTIPGIQVHYANRHICMATRGTGLFGSDDGGVNWRRYAQIPASPLHTLAVLFAPYQRLIRGGVNLLFNGGRAGAETIASMQWIAMSDGSLLLIQENGQSVRPIWQLRKGRRTLHRGATLYNQQIFIADYWSNPKREPVHLYRVHLPSGNTDILFRFEAGIVRHIHNVEIDPFSQRLWSSTGDEDQECIIFHVDPESGKHEFVGQGGQQWRAVSFVFRKEAVYWGTDNPSGENYVWRYDRRRKRIDQIGHVRGPVYYSKGVDNFVIFGTAVEFGHGQQDRFGRLYALKIVDSGALVPVDALSLTEVYKQPKDRWHPKFFGYGLFELNLGEVGENRFWGTHKGFQGGLRSTLFEVKEELHKG